jgi:molybdenum cofactor cytidylyltransferase
MAGEVWAILLAAGESSRMGRPKPLLDWDGITLLQWQVGRLHEAGVQEVVVVLGARAAEIEPSARSSGARVVINREFASGRASSLRAGAAAVSGDAGWIVVLSVDQPRPAWVTRRLLAEAQRSGALVAAPRHKGRGGHPVVLAGALLPEVLTAAEETEGLRAIVRRHADSTLAVEFANSCVIVDLNTPAEYEAALAAFHRGEWDEDGAPR